MQLFTKASSHLSAASQLLPPWPESIVESITLHVHPVIPSVHIKVQKGGKISHSDTIYLHLLFPYSCLFSYI